MKTSVSRRDIKAKTKVKAFLDILKLETKNDYQNIAVAGGLDRFLSLWRKESVKDNGDPYLHCFLQNKLFAIPYNELTPERRKSWVCIATGCLVSKKPKVTDSVGTLSLDQPIETLKSVTTRVVSPLKRLGVETVGDLLRMYPRRLNEVRKVAELRVDEEQTVQVVVWNANEVRLGRSIRGTEAAVGDDSGNIRVIWYNQPYLAKSLKFQAKYVLSGRVAMHGRRLVFESPGYEEIRNGDDLGHLTRTGRLFPVYAGTEGITQRIIRRVVREALNRAVVNVPEILPDKLRLRHGLFPISKAIWEAHYPSGNEPNEEARRRLAFEELFIMQLAVLSRRQILDAGVTVPFLKSESGFLEKFLESLPFDLTGAQYRVLNETLDDLSQGNRPMNRLLQGEVGSGKTVIALAALLITASCEYQGAIMAPTEVLAEQHFMTVRRLLENITRSIEEGVLFSVHLDPLSRPITVGLLLGSMPSKSRRKVRDMLGEGSIDIAIGTHALIQEGVRIPRLGLAVVDEQHRFGVAQRTSLRERGDISHLLVMSATPIPRTLALTLYGDLDLSVLDELPPGRQPIRTRWVKPEKRGGVYQFIRNQVREGRQAFVVYPLIDESETINARAALVEKDRLGQEIFPDLAVGLLHGRMSLKEKQEVMEKFRRKEMDILVSTPVVEVGIDVPNATVMVIEGADRFGLSQLHQFRGRVGRSGYASYCILIAESPSVEAETRLKAMEKLNDGFKLSEVDLELRGPGEFFGTKQSGLPDLKMARLTDYDLLTKARAEAKALLESDPRLSSPEHRNLIESVSKL